MDDGGRLVQVGGGHDTRSWRLNLGRIARHRLGAVGALILVLVTAVALFAPWVAPYDPTAGDFRARLQTSTADHWFGTDFLGRDIFSRVVWGGRVALLVGFVSVTIALAIGSVMGLVAGYFGGPLGTAIMRLVDVMLAFPSILLVIAIVSILGPDIVNAMIAIGVGMAPDFARLVRSVVLAVRDLEFVQAARAIHDRALVVDMAGIIMQRPLLRKGGVTGTFVTVVRDSIGLSFSSAWV